jgi:DNA-binding MarR family transcriptional regulator
MSDDILYLERFIPYRLNRLADAVSREFARIYKDRFGLTRPEWRVLAALGQFGTMTATEIGVHSAQHKTKVSRAVSGLEKRRWLTRKADGSDRRIEHLTLTRTGCEAYREIVPLAKAFEGTVLAGMSESDRAAILDGLSGLERAIGLTATQPMPILTSQMDQSK